MVRHQTLTLAFVGSSPAIPAMSEQGVLCSDFIFSPDPLAQLAEQLPFKQWVWSSNLQRVTKKQPRGCFFACPMEIRRLAMRQSGGLSLARPMPDCLHQKHSAICRIANSIAPPSATPVFLQCKNANERKRVTKKQPRGCFFACPMEIRRLAMRQSGGLSLARPMPDCLHQKHLAICRIANSIAPPSATPIFLQCKNANERKRVTKKVRKPIGFRTFSFIFYSKNYAF